MEDNTLVESSFSATINAPIELRLIQVSVAFVVEVVEGEDE